MNALFAERFQVAMGFAIVDMSAAANNGDWFNMAHYGRVTVMLLKSVGTAGQDATITLQQAKTNAGGSAKALNFTRVDYKENADITTVGQYTVATQAAANTFTISANANKQSIYLIDVTVNMLDIDNGFKWIQGSVADVGANAQLGCVVYLGGQPRFMGGSGVLPSAL